jgi:hypothetical protein
LPGFYLYYDILGRFGISWYHRQARMRSRKGGSGNSGNEIQ